MCGIIAAISSRNVVPVILDGLRRLEYRGYDAAGIAVLTDKRIVRRRTVGKLHQLEDELDQSPISGTIGLGHTRWATHGGISIANTHPHATETVAVVHNGIIENSQQLRDELVKEGYSFESETDTEVVPVLLTHLTQMGYSHLDAVDAVRHKLTGVFSLAIVFADDDKHLYAVRNRAPMLIGHGEKESFLCSSVNAVVRHARRFTVLDDGDFAVVTQNSFDIFDDSGTQVERDSFDSERLSLDVDRGGFRHFMLKEIHEQPDAIRRTVQAYLDEEKKHVRLPWVPFDPKRLNRISIVATGSSRFAGQVAKYWIERVARIPVDVEIASEFSYRDPVINEGTLILAISQSGETADTLKAAQLAKDAGEVLAGLINVPESSLAREADFVLPVLAGPEIGVAASKSFSGQLATLAVFTIYLARSRGEIGRSGEELFCRQLGMLPTHLEEALTLSDRIASLAERFHDVDHMLFLGRDALYPVAREGALLMSSVAYINAIGQSAGELKHGQLALVDEAMPVIVLATAGDHLEKLKSNLMEVRARGGNVIVFADAPVVGELDLTEELTIIELPVQTDDLTAPIAFAVPIQLLAYHVAVLKGTDVDQPRNLAKSVTVE